jgi:hypothetical protein
MTEYERPCQTVCLLARDEARRIAANIAKLLKDAIQNDSELAGDRGVPRLASRTPKLQDQPSLYHGEQDARGFEQVRDEHLQPPNRPEGTLFPFAWH